MTTLSKLRLKKLEEQWERNWRKQVGARGYVTELPPEMTDMRILYRGLARPPNLRGADLVQGLAQLALEWGDQRFAQCVRALFELGIVSKQSQSFTKKRGPRAVTLKDAAMDYAIDQVQAKMKKDPDLSEREACAQVVAELGWKASRTTRFEAACEQVRSATKRARKTVGKQPRG
jgi:hypothetical protein